MSKSMRLLARFVATLARRQPITLPFTPGARGYEWSETFEVARWRGDGEDCVQLSFRTRRDGDVRQQNAEPCDWGLDDVLKLIGEADEALLEHLDATLGQIESSESPTLDAIDDEARTEGDAMMIGGDVYTLATVDGRTALILQGGRSADWKLDEVVLRVRQGR